MNLQFMRCGNEREQTIRQLVIAKKQINFMIMDANAAITLLEDMT